jgi:hypothetical protein
MIWITATMLHLEKISSNTNDLAALTVGLQRLATVLKACADNVNFLILPLDQLYSIKLL